MLTAVRLGLTIFNVRRLFCVVLVSVAAAALGLSAAPAQACPTRHSAAVVTGFDAPTHAAAHLIAGWSHNSLLVRFTAGWALTDATLTVQLPHRDWLTPLVPAGGLSTEDANVGAVAVRPAPALGLPEPTIPAGNACTWTDEQPEMAASITAQIVVVPHLSCAPGQQIAVRILNVRASDRVGWYGLVVRAVDNDGSSSATVAFARVQAPPTVRLRVLAPSSVVSSVTFILQVEAIDRFGRIDRDYRGSVAVVTRPFDCSQYPNADAIAYTFTAADRGTATISVVFSTLSPHQLYVYDVANAALPGLSNTFTTTPGDLPPICPVHYD